ncbi:thioredoxin family protein [Methylophaga sp.]|uniref:thioredoxin family protein n=1 Tax=Methylophaga sp. TaxID=2024840 RepID=UPI003A931A23
MNMDQAYADSGYAEETLTFEQTSELPGKVLLEFGAPWCGHCQAARAAITEVVNEHTELRHIKIYDGKGKRLGRGFKVKLWPTLILLDNGQEVDRLVRPLRAEEVRELMSKLN